MYLIKTYKEQEPLKETYCNDQFEKIAKIFVDFHIPMFSSENILMHIYCHDL